MLDLKRWIAFVPIQSAPYLDFLSWVASVAGLTYLAQVGNWGWFVVVAIVAALLYAALKYMTHRPVAARIEQLRQKQLNLEHTVAAYGIQDLYNMQDPDQQDARNRATRTIIDAGHTFSLLSLTAASYIDPSLHRHWDSLRPKLDEGVPFRLLVMSPFSPEKEVRDRLNAGGHDRVDSKFDWAQMIDLHNRYSNVAVRLSPINIYGAVFFSESQMVYDPYHLGKLNDRIENHFIAVELGNQKEAKVGHSYFEILKSHFEFLWAASDSLERVIRENREAIEARIGDIPHVVERYA